MLPEAAEGWPQTVQEIAILMQKVAVLSYRRPPDRPIRRSVRLALVG